MRAAHRHRRSACGCSRSPPARIGFIWPNLTGGFGAPIAIGDLDDGQAPELVAADRRGLPGLLLRGARLRDPVSTPASSGSCPARTRPATARRSTSGRSTSAARTSAASRTRASRTSGSSAPATARATTGSGSRPTAPQYGPAPRGMDRFSITRRRRRRADHQHRQDHARAAARRARPARPHPAAHADGLHLMTVTTDPDRRGPCEPTTPGREPEERLPVPRPPAEVAPVERFTSRAVGPRRRADAGARGPGRPPVVERALGRLPRRRRRHPVHRDLLVLRAGAARDHRAAARQPRPHAQQVTAVERGYNLYEANCARCHGANGEGGIGPALNRQDKLFAHLDGRLPQQRPVVGGRYVCGNPNSLMPVWSNQGTRRDR